MRGAFDSWVALKRQRMPFLWLTASACGGILLGAFVLFQPLWWAIAALGLLVVCAWPGNRIWKSGDSGALLAGVGCAFAALSGWQTRGSPAEVAAEALLPAQIALVEGVVVAQPREFGHEQSAFRAESRWVEVGGWQGELRVSLQVVWRGKTPEVGDRFRAEGVLSRFHPPRNPGAFDAAAWAASRGIYWRFRVPMAQTEDFPTIDKSLWLQRAAASARKWTSETLTAGLDRDSQQAHLILAMTLGDTRPLDETLLQGFRATGTFHLFSVSGLHVGMLGAILWFVLGVLGVPRRVMVAIIIPALFFYALVTGWKPASVRAAVMASFVLVGLLAGRPPVVLNSLLAAAFFLLLVNPRELFNPGFQLSFCVVGTLILLCLPITSLMRRPLAVDAFIPPRLYSPAERMRNAFAGWIAPLGAVALAAWTGSALLMLTYFHLVSVAAVPANMVCVPLAFVVMAVAMLALLGGLISGAVATIFNNVNWLLAGMLISIVEAFASLPGAYFYVGSRPSPQTEIVIFDFGRGGGAYVEAGGERWMVDCGPSKEFSRTVLPFLRSRGVNRLDGLVLTHGDATHVGAAKNLIQTCRPRVVVESGVPDRSPARRSAIRQAEEIQLPVRQVFAGDRVALGRGAEFEVLFPPRDTAIGGLADDKALVLRLKAGTHTVLFLSDAGPPTQAWLLQHARDALVADVLAKGAHSSGAPLSTDFLDAVNPHTLIASSVSFPRREVVPPETIQAAEMRGIQLLRQDDTGAVTLRIKKANLHVHPFLNPMN